MAEKCFLVLETNLNKNTETIASVICIGNVSLICIPANYVPLHMLRLRRDYSHPVSRECSKRNFLRFLLLETTASRSRGWSCLRRQAEAHASPVGLSAGTPKLLLLLPHGVLPETHAGSQQGQAA